MKGDRPLTCGFYFPYKEDVASSILAAPTVETCRSGANRALV